MGHSCCSETMHVAETRTAEDQIRDIINLISVYKNEEAEGVSTCIEPKTAKELVKKLEQLAKQVGGVGEHHGGCGCC